MKLLEEKNEETIRTDMDANTKLVKKTYQRRNKLNKDKGEN